MIDAPKSQTRRAENARGRFSLSLSLSRRWDFEFSLSLSLSTLGFPNARRASKYRKTAESCRETSSLGNVPERDQSRGGGEREKTLSARIRKRPGSVRTRRHIVDFYDAFVDPKDGPGERPSLFSLSLSLSLSTETETETERTSSRRLCASVYSRAAFL